MGLQYHQTSEYFQCKANRPRYSKVLSLSLSLTLWSETFGSLFWFVKYETLHNNQTISTGNFPQSLESVNWFNQQRHFFTWRTEIEHSEREREREIRQRLKWWKRERDWQEGSWEFARESRELAESVNENWGRRENELLSKCLYKVKEIILWNRKNKKLLIFCFEVYLTANIQPDRGRGK